MIILDLDDTLFDAFKFKQKFFEGESLSYQEIQDRLYAMDDEEIYLRGKEIIQNCGNDFLFHDTVSFLDACKKSAHKLVLLSKGHERFQKVKIEDTDIKSYFEKGNIYIPDWRIENGKMIEFARIIQDIPESEMIFFVNDKVSESLEAKQKFPHIICIMKRRYFASDESYSKCGMPCFDSLMEIYEYVQKSSKSEARNLQDWS